MKANDSKIDLVYLLRLAVILWLAYLLALATIDKAFYLHPIFPPRFYLLNGLDALLVFGLVLWRQKKEDFGRIFLPLVIGLLSLVPILTSSLAVLGIPPSPANRPEAIILRIMPLLFMALVLTAWQYRWRVVVFFSVGSTLFALGPHLLFYQPSDVSLFPPLIVMLIQAVSFLTVGYFINVLVSRMQQQQRALEEAHARLVDYAGTLEDLTLSRERNRLARELHDTLAHTLSALSVQLETAKAYWDVDPAAAQAMLNTSLAVTRSGLEETRRALKALRATPLEDMGLLLALRQLAEEYAARANLQLTLSLPRQLPALPQAVEQATYRIAQEALANVMHHANARMLTVSLMMDGGVLSLQVQDDGVGFSGSPETANGHFGLSGMQERAQLVGGQLVVVSEPGEGVTIQFTVRV